VRGRPGALPSMPPPRRSCSLAHEVGNMHLYMQPSLTQLLLQRDIKLGLLARVQLAQHKVPRKGGHLLIRLIVPLLLRWQVGHARSLAIASAACALRFAGATQAG
jgi:hypothetical protein